MELASCEVAEVMGAVEPELVEEAAVLVMGVSGMEGSWG